MPAAKKVKQSTVQVDADNNSPAVPAVPAADPHPTVSWMNAEVWPLARKLYATLPKEASGVGGVTPFDIDTFKSAMADDGVYTCTVTANAFKEDNFSFGSLPTQDAVETTQAMLLEDTRPGWQLNPIPVRVSSIAGEPHWGNLDILALDEVRLAVALTAAKLVKTTGGKVTSSVETTALKQLCSRIKVTFHFVQDGDAFEQEKWLARIRLRQATKYAELTGVSRTRQIFITKEKLNLRPEGCNQKQAVEWFRAIQQQQEKEGCGKDPDLDLSKHAIQAHFALWVRVAVVFDLLLEFDVGGNKHTLSTLKGLQRLAAMTCTDAGGSDVLMTYSVKMLLVAFARGTLPRDVSGKDFQAALNWALLLRRVAFYFRNKLKEVNVSTCFEHLCEDPFIPHLAWPKGNALRTRITDYAKTASGSCTSNDTDDDAVSLWKALFDRRPDIMQIATAELAKNSVIPAEAFLEAVSHDKDCFQLDKFREDILPVVTQPPVPVAPVPPPPPAAEPPAADGDGGMPSAAAVEPTSAPPRNSAYFKHVALGGVLEDMVNAMPSLEFATVMGKIEDREHKYLSFEVKPPPDVARTFIVTHPRLQSARVKEAQAATADEGATTKARATLLFQIDGKNCVRHYGSDALVTPYKTSLPRNAADLEAALSAMHGPHDLTPGDRQKVSALGELRCKWVTQIFDGRRSTHHTHNKTLLRKYAGKKGGAGGPVMELKLCYHNMEFTLPKEQAIQHQLIFRNSGGDGNSQHRAKPWGIASLPEPVESIAYAMNYSPPPVTLKYCSTGSSFTRALSHVPLRAGLGGDDAIKERQLWVPLDVARAATANQLAAEPLNGDDDEAVATPTAVKNSQDSAGGNDSEDEIRPVLVPLQPWAVSEKAHRELINIYAPTHVVAWNLGQGELAIACLRHRVQFLGFAVNNIALDVAREHVRSVMLEEHVRCINDGFLFRRELRTHRSVGGDDDVAKVKKNATSETGNSDEKPKSVTGKSKKAKSEMAAGSEVKEEEAARSSKKRKAPTTVTVPTSDSDRSDDDDNSDESR